MQEQHVYIMKIHIKHFVGIINMNFLEKVKALTALVLVSSFLFYALHLRSHQDDYSRHNQQVNID